MFVVGNAVGALATLVSTLAQLYVFVLIGRVICSWVNADPQRIYAIRRRRAVAALVLGIASVLILVLLLGGGSKSPHVAAAIVRAPKPTLDQRESAAIDKVLSYTPYISRGSPNKREVALTFDDGPGPYSPQVIDILTRENVPATFFVIGRYLDGESERAQASRAVLKKIVAGGPNNPKRFSRAWSASSLAVTSAFSRTKPASAFCTAGSENVNFSISLQLTHQSA